MLRSKNKNNGDIIELEELGEFLETLGFSPQQEDVEFLRTHLDDNREWTDGHRRPLAVRPSLVTPPHPYAGQWSPTRWSLVNYTPATGQLHAGHWSTTRRPVVTHTLVTGQLHAGHWSTTRWSLVNYTPASGHPHAGHWLITRCMLISADYNYPLDEI